MDLKPHESVVQEPRVQKAMGVVIFHVWQQLVNLYGILTRLTTLSTMIFFVR